MTNRNLGQVLHDCAAKYDGRPFVTIAETGHTVSYREFETLTNRLAHGLLDRFRGGNTYMCIMLENGVEYLAVTYAMKKTGFVEVSVNREFRGAALARMIALTRASVLITSDSHLDAIDQVHEDLPDLRTLIIVGSPELARTRFPKLNVLEFGELLSDCTGHLSSDASETDPAAILFTSGTTGISKGCVLSHRYAIRTAENVIPSFRVTTDDCVYSPYPLSHIGPAYYDVLPAMMTGGQVVLRERFSVSAFWPELERYGVTWFMMLGSVQQLLWAAAPCAEEKQHRVTRCWATPAPVPKREFDARFGLHLVPGGGYGSTDAGWVVAPQWDHPGGIVLPHYEVRIVDDNGHDVAPGAPGQLLVRGTEPGLTADGYFGLPEATAKAWQDGWLHTGDVARVDADGLFYFLHRMSERIRVRGEMVSAFEVEEGILAHADVEDCAAIGVPGEIVEEEIRAFVVRKPGATLSADALRDHCAGQMARFMVPRDIVFVDDLPRTPTGKPDKRRLAEL